MVGGWGGGSLTDHVSVPAIPSLDGQTDDRGPGSSLLANPASLKGREGDRRKTKGKGRGGGKRGLAVPTTQQRGPRLAPLFFSVRPKATQNRLGGAEGRGWAGARNAGGSGLFLTGVAFSAWRFKKKKN